MGDLMQSHKFHADTDDSKPKTIKHPEENIGENVLSLG